jgi:hypothetical protein
MLIYLWIPKSSARTDAIIRESAAILLFFGVVETKKFEASHSWAGSFFLQGEDVEVKGLKILLDTKRHFCCGRRG